MSILGEVWGTNANIEWNWTQIGGKNESECQRKKKKKWRTSVISLRNYHGVWNKLRIKVNKY